MKLLLLGPGYLGSQIIHDILNSTPSQIETLTVYVRKEADAKTLNALPVPGNDYLQTALGDLEDTDRLQGQVSQHDVVIDCAGALMLEASKAIVEGLKNRSKPSIYIRTSGAGVLCDYAQGTKASEQDIVPLSDLDEATVARRMWSPPEHPMATIDKVIMDAVKPFPQIRLAIMYPPCIYGDNQGHFPSRSSIQIPNLIKASIAAGCGITVGPGLNCWSCVHVQDVSKAYLLILRRLQTSKSPRIRYFIESGKFEWASLSMKIAQVLQRSHKIGDGKVRPATEEERAQYLFGPFSTIAYGSNTVVSADRLRALGWNANASRSIGPLDSIEREVAKALQG